MQYAYHIDDSIMGNPLANLQKRYRTDVSTIIFFYDDYQDGEFMIKTANENQNN